MFDWTDLKLTDAHTHLENPQRRRERTRMGVRSLVCAKHPEEARILMGLFPRTGLAASAGRTQVLIPTFGLHPWYAADFPMDQVTELLAPFPVIGEIGMDSTWCDVPLPLQEQVFRAQLATAQSLNKPVILHTKGQEHTISSILSEFPGRYLVHWYSAKEGLERYLALDCYCSVGPDVFWNEPVQDLARQVPANRLLVETDGMDAVRWAWEEAPKESAFPGAFPKTAAESLAQTLMVTARLRRADPRALARQIAANFDTFWRDANP